MVLIEAEVPNKDTLSALKAEVSADFYVPTTGTDRFQCFSRQRELDLSEVHLGARTSIRRLVLGTHTGLLVLVHGVDPRNNDPDTRQSFAQTVATEVRHATGLQSTNRVMMLGDFNINPYDPGMNQAPAFNAMMTKTCVAPGVRTHLKEEYDLYYNPMWSLFGDGSTGPAGTVYDTSNQGPYGWSMFDQVVISHSLVHCFHSVEILTQAGEYSLADKKGRPSRRRASDHFPILVEMSGGGDE